MSSFPHQPSGGPPTLHLRREPADLAAALRAAQALVGQHEPGLGRPYLAHVDENQALARGSAAPLLGLSWRQLPCRRPRETARRRPRSCPLADMRTAR